MAAPPASATESGTGAGTGRRVLWTVIDQALSSLGNFGLGLLVARTASARQFGAFAVAYALYLLLVAASRAVASDPLLVRHADRPGGRSDADAASTGTALVGGAAAGIVCAGAGLVLPAPTGGAVLALAVCLPGLLLQDAWRHASFAAARPARAALNDGFWTVTSVLAILLLGAAGVDSVGALVLAWGVTGGAAGVLGGLQAGTRPRPSAAAAWWRRERDLASRFLGEAAVTVGTPNAVLVLVGWIGGLQVAGALRAAEVLLGPVRLFASAAWSSAVPELVRLRRRSPEHFLSRCGLVGAALAVSTAAWGLASHLLPDRAGTALLGESWRGARDVLGIVTLDWTLIGLAIGAAVGLRALGDARRSLRTRLALAPLTILLPVVGVGAGARGAAWGYALSSVVAVVLWWQQLRRAVPGRRPDRRPTDLGASG